MQNQQSIFIVTILLISLGLIPFFIPHVALPFLSRGALEGEFNEGSVLFLGDLMLARHVETLTQEHGLNYPFLGMRSILSGSDLVVANFEATVPVAHTKTPNHTLKFSVRDDFFPIIKETGIDMLSLANNHTYDYGHSGYRHTWKTCFESKIVCGGHPYEVNNASISYKIIGETTVGIIFLHALTVDSEDWMFQANIKDVLKGSEVQVAYIHWGEEYKEQHNDAQELLARALIDSGIDAVIGHHPHVVQDIELYKGKPIFYSLGNFVFDQYFDPSVEEGLAVKLSIEKESLEYTLIPLSSKDVKSQPRVMNIDEKQTFLGNLVFTGDNVESIRQSDSRLVVKRSVL